MTNYPVGDFIIRLKNAALAKQRVVSTPKTKFIKEVAKVLKKEGFLEDVKESGEQLVVSLKFHKKEPRLIDAKLVSTPGLRIYMNVDEIKARKGISILILSTPKGAMSSKSAIKDRVGGEVIAELT